MADNVTADPGTGGATFATDDIAGVHYPRSKVVWGVDGVATDVSAADPLPVTAASLPLPSGAATAANQTTGNTSLATLAGAVAGTEMQVDVLTMPTVTVTGSVDATNAAFDVVGGGLEATALRVTLASDSTGVLSVDDNGGSLTVDGTVAATQSGTWVLGANSGVDVGDVTINNASGASAVNIQDGGNSITVDGTVGVSGTVAVTDNAGSLTVDAPVATPVFVRLSDGAAAITTLPVSLASLPALAAGTNNIGDVDILSIAAGDNNIGNVDIVTMPNVTLAAGTNTNEVVGDVADGATAAGNPLGIGLIARTANRTAVTDGQAVRAAGDDIGRTVVCVGQVRDLVNHQHTQIASSAAETTIVTAAGAGVFADLTQLVITNQTATAVTVTIKDATAGTTRLIVALAASGGAVIPFHRPVKQATANNNWTATLSSAAVTVNIFAQFEANV